MVMIAKLKARLRQTAFYQPLLKRHAERQEQLYKQLRDQAYATSPNVFGAPGYAARARTRLYQHWQPPMRAKGSTREVRLFVLDRPSRVGPWYQSDLARNFDVAVFNTTRHMHEYNNGQRDLLTPSVGIDLFNRTIMPAHPKDFLVYRELLQRDILTAITAAHHASPIDLCFAYGEHYEFTTATLNAIRAMGIPVVLLSLDDKHAFSERPLGYPNGQQPLIGACDVHLTNSLECVRWYLAAAAAVYYFPEGTDPELHHPLNIPRDIPVSFVGGAYGYRFEFIRQLKAAGVPVQCFGRGWENGEVSDMNLVFNRTRINLGIGMTGLSTKMTCLKARDFDVAASGSLYLTTFDAELSRHYHIGRELLCYHNELDAIEQIHYYLENTEEAEAIASAARTRVLQEHTWTHRFEGLLEWMGILA
jgi:spore maturation protein CgeB